MNCVNRTIFSALFAVAIMSLSSPAGAGDIICKVLPQLDMPANEQAVGTYVLKQVKDAAGRVTAAFNLIHAIGEERRVIDENVYVTTISMRAEESLYAYDSYLSAGEGQPDRALIPREKMGFYARVYGGPKDDPEVVIQFWLEKDASGNPGKVMDVFGLTGDSYFLCEEAESNEVVLPEGPRSG